MSISEDPGSGEQWSEAFGHGSLEGMTAYEESFVAPLFTPWAEFLLDQLRPMPGERFLDLATGPGTVARLAALRLGPSGAVVAADLSEAMLSIARNKPPLAGAAGLCLRRGHVSARVAVLPGPTGRPGGAAPGSQTRGPVGTGGVVSDRTLSGVRRIGGGNPRCLRGGSRRSISGRPLGAD